MQGNVKNYLGKQKIVKAPLHWQSSPDHPTTELAYITKKEKDLLLKKDLHKSLKGGVNRGPSGIISLNGWGDRGGGFADRSFAGQERPGRDVQVTTGSPHGDGPRTITQRTKTVSPKDTFAQSWSGPKRFFGLTGGYRNLKTPGVTPERGGAYQSRIGGLGRGLLSLLGGIPGRVASGLMTAKNWATRTPPTIEEEEDITSDYQINPTTGQYEYVGGSMEDTMKEFRQKHPLDLRTNVGGTNQDYQTALGEGWATNYTGADTNNDFIPQNFNMALPIGSAEGGRIGYADRGFVDEDINIEGPGFDVNENLMASDPDMFDALNDMSMNIFGKGVHELTSEEYEMLVEMATDQASAGQDQGLASLV